MKGQTLKVPLSGFPEWWINSESHAITLILWNGIPFKRYSLDQDSVRWIHCPVKMANWHFPTGSHNFVQCGVIDHDQMATVTLQTTYDPTLSCVYPKVACPLEISSGSGIYSDVVTLPAAQHGPVHCVDVVYRDVITRSHDSRDHHHDAPLIFRVKKSLLPVNNTFFIATVSVVKDAADNPDWQWLGDIWENDGTICISTYARTMPPTSPLVSNSWLCPNKWGLDKMTDILQMIYSNELSWKKMITFRFRF